MNEREFLNLCHPKLRTKNGYPIKRLNLNKNAREYGVIAAVFSNVKYISDSVPNLEFTRINWGDRTADVLVEGFKYKNVDLVQFHRELKKKPA